MQLQLEILETLLIHQHWQGDLRISKYVLVETNVDIFQHLICKVDV